MHPQPSRHANSARVVAIDTAGNEFSTRRAKTPWARLVSPLGLAAYATWLAIAITVIDAGALAAGDAREWSGAVALLAMIVLFGLRALRDGDVDCLGSAWITVLQGVLVVVADLLLREGQVVILLIIVAAQLVLVMPVRRALVWLALFNLAIAMVWFDRAGSLAQVAAWMVPVLGFQVFAGLTGYYAGISERSREHLAQVNAELLATRHLLEESARGGERLKISRELHDVAGHKLTALKLTLARLQRDPALAGALPASVEAVATCKRLADELLEDIRSVVSELRAHDGLDLHAALEALARPVAGTRISVAVEPGLRVDGLDQAQALLRCAQEAITNALRHGRAGEIRVHCLRREGAIELEVCDDGNAVSDPVPGNGLRGMRERLESLGGALQVQAMAGRGVRVRAQVPENPR
ncbi:MAG: ATP-binding protein [Xanthomonadales bacterium]|nr:ATP-binding protein [Xanthomonadales bacterium]